jgi:hypothetical protein
MSTDAEYQLVQNLVDDWPVSWKMRSVSFERIAERVGVSLDAGRHALRLLRRHPQYKHQLHFNKATGSSSHTHAYLFDLNTPGQHVCASVATSSSQHLGPRY